MIWSNIPWLETWPDIQWPHVTWPTIRWMDVAFESVFALTAFSLGLSLVVWLAVRHGDAVYRGYCAVRIAAAALIRITWALVHGLVAWYAVKFGLRFVDWDQTITLANGAAALLLWVALTSATKCVTYILEALPGISPRRMSTGPGSSRLASRSDQRRAGII